MQADKKINEKILALTRSIREKYPELQKFLGEMPITIPNDSNPEITLKVLEDYYNSLSALIKRYEENGHLKKE